MTKAQRAGDAPIAVDVEKDKSYYWCSCGKSAKQPLCDGSHKGYRIYTSGLYKAEETKKSVFLCMQSKQTISHLCDGSHNKK